MDYKVVDVEEKDGQSHIHTCVCSAQTRHMLTFLCRCHCSVCGCQETWVTSVVKIHMFSGCCFTLAAREPEQTRTWEQRGFCSCLCWPLHVECSCSLPLQPLRLSKCLSRAEQCAACSLHHSLHTSSPPKAGADHACHHCCCLGSTGCLAHGIISNGLGTSVLAGLSVFVNSETIVWHALCKQTVTMY